MEHLDQVRREYPDYHCAPVPAWGRSSAPLLIVGLAPGLHGANRSGKPFVGDQSGATLFAALHQVGLASTADAATAKLTDVRITNAVKCLPPGNRPTGPELRRCQPWLEDELRGYVGPKRKTRAIVALGGVAYSAVLRAVGVRGTPFAHGGEVWPTHRLALLASYHPSRLNVNTKRLTVEMLQQVLQRALELVRSDVSALDVSVIDASVTPQSFALI